MTADPLARRNPAATAGVAPTEASVTFEEITAAIDGRLVQLWLLRVEAPTSDAEQSGAHITVAHIAYAKRSPESFLHGVATGLQRLRVTPNILTLSVGSTGQLYALLGRHGLRGRRLSALTHTFGFELRCQFINAVRRGNSAPNTPDATRHLRSHLRQHLRASLSARTLAELNEILADADARANAAQQITYAQAAGSAPPLSAWPDLTGHLSRKVDASGQVLIHGDHYRVPNRLSGRQVHIRLNATEVLIFRRGALVARHPYRLHEVDGARPGRAVAIGAAGVALLVILAWWLIVAASASGLLLVLIVAIAVGLNVGIWGTIGLCRFTNERLLRRDRVAKHETPPDAPDRDPITMCVLMAAHNEERIIERSITSAARTFAMADIYIVSDASTDRTVELCRLAGANVLALERNRGKAGALEAAIDYFELTKNYDTVLLLDADAELDDRYAAGATAHFADPEVAAVAGYAKTIWDPRQLSLEGQLVVSYRDRLYTLQQHLIRYGQTSRWFNVVYIAPGFASGYRSEVLEAIDMNPPGLIIEDFNMTFQVHRRKLGRIAFSPSIRAGDQDPDNLHDYTRQTYRWILGFWQTIRHNGLWPGKFWLALLLIILESLVAALAFLTVAAIFAALGMLAFFALAYPPGPALAGFGWLYTTVGQFAPLGIIAAAVLLPDYLTTCVMAALRRRPRYLYLGFGFPMLRAVDAVISLWAMVKAWTTRSNGVWKSPARR